MRDRERQTNKQVPRANNSNKDNQITINSKMGTKNSIPQRWCVTDVGCIRYEPPMAGGARRRRPGSGKGVRLRQDEELLV